MRILNNEIVISISNTITYVKEIIVLETSKCSASERVLWCVSACACMLMEHMYMHLYDSVY